MSIIGVKTAELIGPTLDWAVAKCNGKGIEFDDPNDPWLTVDGVADQPLHSYTPSSDWSQGGPLIERERIGLWANSTGYFAEKRHFGRHHKAGRNYGEGSTPLIAAMRCLVAANLGDVVSVPEELVQQPTEGSDDE